MRFECNRTKMEESINIVLKAIPVRTTMPVLECMVVKAVNGVITLTTNDMNLGIETSFDADVAEDGIVLVNAKMLSDVVRKFDSDEFHFAADDEYRITLTSGSSKFHLSGIDSDEFPMLPQMDKNHKITISQMTLRDMINQTIFSISKNENNKIITGELFEITGDKFMIASLDLHRVSQRIVRLKESYDNTKVVIPGKALTELSKILQGGVDDEMEIYFSENHALFEFDRTILITQLIEGNYYNVDQMMSNEYETKVTINRMEFYNSLDRSTLLNRESENQPIVLHINDQDLNLDMNTKMGSMNDKISITKEGKDLDISFSSKYLMDVLKVLDLEEVTMYLVNSRSPVFIKDDETYNYLILPISMQG